MIIYRPATAADLAFIIGTWCDSYKSSHYAGILFTDDYADVMHRQLERLLDRPETTALVACDREDPAFLYGHIVGELGDGAPVVHYVFVRKPYRGDGIARGLVGALGVSETGYFVYTCKTGVVADVRDKIPRARFDPNGIRYSRANRRRRL